MTTITISKQSDDNYQPYRFADHELPQITAAQFKHSCEREWSKIKLLWKTVGKFTESLEHYIDRKMEKWTRMNRKGSCFGEAIEASRKIVDNPISSKSEIVSKMADQNIAAYQAITDIFIKIKNGGSWYYSALLDEAKAFIQDGYINTVCRELPTMKVDESQDLKQIEHMLKKTLTQLRKDKSNVLVFLLGTGTPGHAISLQINPTIRVYDPGREFKDLKNEEEAAQYMGQVIKLGLSLNDNHKTTLYSFIVKDG